MTDKGAGLKFTWLLLFIGFSCLAGWIGTNGILLTQYTNSRHFENPAAIFSTIAFSLLTASFLIVPGALTLIWGVKRLKKTTEKKRLITRSIVPVAILSPAFSIAGMMIILLAPYCFAHIKTVLIGPNIVQSAVSPDNLFEAYVVDKPSIDGPNHHLYIRNKSDQACKFIARLPEDVDFNQKIHWSPESNVVVFKTYFSLIGVTVPDCKTSQVKLGGECHWRENGTFWVDYDNVKKIDEIKFPGDGKFAYRLSDIDTIHTVRIGSNLPEN